jgi:hypothetical protein
LPATADFCDRFDRAAIHEEGLRMKIASLGCLGLFLGAIAGGIIGVGLGFLWIKVFHTSDFEGYSGMLVFYTFMPIGIILGAVIGGVGLGFVGGRNDSEKRPSDAP